MTQPGLLQVNLVVADLAETIRFLGLLGIPAEHPGYPHLEIGLPGSEVSIEFDELGAVDRWNSGAPDRTGGSTVVVLSVADRDSVDRCWQQVVHGGFGSHQRPFDAFWGSRFAVVVDADGNQFGLMSPRDDALRSAEPGPAPR